MDDKENILLYLTALLNSGMYVKPEILRIMREKVITKIPDAITVEYIRAIVEEAEHFRTDNGKD